MTVEKLHKLSEQIRKAAKAAARNPEDVALLLATKTQAAAAIEAVLAAGHRLFGENRVQEAAEKWPDLKKRYPDTRLHLIGPLQTNKVKQALEIFDLIETLDREKLAKTLAAQNCAIPCFVQVNTGEETQKAGIAPKEADDFIAFCRSKACGLDIQGLMCIPPADETPAPHFALLHKIAARNGLKRLSMGMSGDFETAIAFGATEIRLGSAVFGDRNA